MRLFGSNEALMDRSKGTNEFEAVVVGGGVRSRRVKKKKEEKRETKSIRFGLGEKKDKAQESFGLTMFLFCF